MSVDRLRERIAYLEALNQVGKELGASTDCRRILEIALGESLRMTRFTCGSAALLDPRSGDGAAYTERATQGCPSTFIPNIQLDLDVLQGERARFMPDQTEADWVPDHDGVRSALIAPVYCQGAAAGVIRLHSSELVAVDQNALEFVEGLVAQLSVALNNAHLHQELVAQNHRLGQRTEQIKQMARVSQVIRSDQSLEEMLQDLVDIIHESLKFNLVLLSLVEGQGPERVLRRIASAGLPATVWEKLRQIKQPFASIAPLLRDEFRIGNAYLIPEQRQDIYQGKLDTYTALENSENLGPQDWHAADLFLIPLHAASGQTLGLLSLDDPVDRLRPTAETIASVDFLANQTAIALENARLYEEVRGFAAELEHRVEERTQDLALERDRVRALLRITGELATSLDLNRVLFRALELVSEASGASQGAIFLLDQITGELTFQAALGQPESLPSEGKRIPFKRGEGLIGWVIQHHQSAIVTDTETDERWAPIPELEGEHRSALAAPLFTGEDIWGVLTLFSPTPNLFAEGQLQLVETAAAQVSPSIYNAELYKLIREQSEQLGSMMRAEREETAKTVSMLESVADGVMVVDAEGQVILFNAAAERMFELERRQIVGQSISKFISMWGKAGEIWGPAVEEWARLPEDSVHGQQSLEDRLEFGEKIISVNLAPVIYTTSGLPSFLGTVSIFRDITRDVELDRMQREWVSTVSHELRTPMTSIKGYADLLVLGAVGQISESQREFLNIIKNNADRLSVLVNDLLDISRIETGRLKLDIKPIDPYELVETVVNNLYGRREQEGKEIDIQAELPEDLPLMSGDIDRVTQILTNLLDNAFNYTPRGGSITILAQGFPARRIVEISVVDTGIGISPEDRVRILDRFYRSDHPDVQRVSGTGLGLAIVNHLVEMHGGQLSIHSEGLGKGSTFSFTLPIAVADDNG
jgi:signal transduction histidine kinase